MFTPRLVDSAERVPWSLTQPLLRCLHPLSDVSDLNTSYGYCHKFVFTQINFTRYKFISIKTLMYLTLRDEK